jgi:hypothetical protein
VRGKVAQSGRGVCRLGCVSLVAPVAPHFIATLDAFVIAGAKLSRLFEVDNVDIVWQKAVSGEGALRLVSLPVSARRESIPRYIPLCTKGFYVHTCEA